MCSGAARRQFPPHFLERHALHDDPARTGERGQEQAFPAEDRGSDAAGELDVVIDALVEGDDAAGVDLKDLGGLERELDEIAAAVDEDRPRPGEPFQNESLAAEKARPDALDELDVDLDRVLRAQETIALNDHALARGQVKRLDAPRVAPGEAGLPGSIRAEVGPEQ